MLTFVLSGGGARGAYQAGALRALIEAGYRPEMLVGASVGAINATYLAVHGVDEAGVEGLCRAWHDAAGADLLSTRRAWLAARALLRLPDATYFERMRSFFVEHGVSPDLTFGQIEHGRLVIVATDLNRSRPRLFGSDPKQSVLDALLASSALPPWIPPIAQDDSLYTDGGFVSNLPIEPALHEGASKIVALDIIDPRGIVANARGLLALVSKAASTAANRQAYLEKALAEAKGVPVRHLHLLGEAMTPVWDFSQAGEHVGAGYEVARRQIEQWRREEQALHWWQKLPVPKITWGSLH